MSRILMGPIALVIAVTTVHAGIGLSHEPKQSWSGPRVELRSENLQKRTWHLAQVDSDQATKYTVGQEMLEGEMMAANISAQGKFALGLVIGVPT